MGRALLEARGVVIPGNPNTARRAGPLKRCRHDDRPDLSRGSPPDIEPYRAGNTGVPFMTTFDSGVPGPHVMIAAITHGNELCGAIAVDHLMRQGVRPQRGRLTLGFMNHEAYHRSTPRTPP